MCDPGEKISQTLKREFMEEATDSTGANKSSISQIEEHLSSLFENGVEVYIFVVLLSRLSEFYSYISLNVIYRVL